MSVYDRTDQINRRLKVLNLAIKLWLAHHPSAKRVRVRHVKEALVDYFNGIKEPVPNWVFSDNILGRLMKKSGYTKKRKPQFVTYELDSNHADRMLKELETIERELQKSKINLPKYLEALVAYKKKACRECDLPFNEPLNFRDQLRLTETMLAHLNAFNPEKFRNVLRGDLERSIEILKEDIAEMGSRADYRKTLREWQAFRKAHRNQE